MSGSLHQNTQSLPAYDPRDERVGPAWRLVVAGLLLMAVASLSLKSVCRPDTPGAVETGFGVRHEKRGVRWFHCEPWIRRVLRG